jgi:hypothetical protein
MTGRHARDGEHVGEPNPSGPGERSGWVLPREQVDRLLDRTRADIDDDRLARLAAQAHEAVRALNHLTITRPAVPSPRVYPVLGSLSALAWALQQLFPQLAGCLAASLDTHTTGYRVVQDDGGDPLTAVSVARYHFSNTADLARELAEELAAAHDAIARQGYIPVHGALDADDPGASDTSGDAR